MANTEATVAFLALAIALDRVTLLTLLRTYMDNKATTVAFLPLVHTLDRDITENIRGKQREYTSTNLGWLQLAAARAVLARLLGL